ncbi:MAG: ferritin family protein [Nitrospirae bacterium]|nr:ferritin family protein [Nitrospirota bacterium]
MNAIEISIRMETDAIKFYGEAAGRTSHPVGKKMFLSVVEDEKRHLEMLRTLFRGLDLTINNVSPMRNVKTVFEELKDEMMQRVEASVDELEVFKIAMNMEKEGVEFYKKTLTEAKTEKERMLFKQLIHEEEQHFAIFQNTYSFMSDTGNWFMWDEHSIVDGGTPWA